MGHVSWLASESTHVWNVINQAKIFYKYSQVQKCLDSETILVIVYLYPTTEDLKWSHQDVNKV